MTETTINGSLALEEKKYKVITIAATQKQEDIKLRVAAYARVSSSSEDQMNSFAAQNSYYTALISSQENWKMVDIYADSGITGTSAEKREDFQRLLADCRRGLIDRVLVKSISRFALNAKDCLETVRELKSIGVSVFFEEQNIDTGNMSGELLTSIFAAIAQKESESISANIRWGIHARMQSGTFLPSHQPFGYMLVNKTITIDEVPAEYVRRIFDMYIGGLSTQEIADYLNEAKKDCPALDRVWKYKSVARILRNEKYIGDSLWQKSFRTETLPRKEMPNRNNLDQYYAVGTHSPIIAKETFDAAQALLARRNEAKNADQINASPFPAGFFICEQCGAHIRRKKVNGVYYRSCRRHDLDGSKCSLEPFRESEVEKAFLRLYYKLKHYGNRILEPLLHDLQEVQNRRMLWSMEVVELNKIMSELTSQNQRLAELKKLGSVDPDIFIYKSNKLVEQLRTAKLQKERILNAQSDDTIPRTRELLEILDAGPEFLESFDAELLGELVDKIIVESNEQIRFRLKNGLELPERIERTVR